MGNHAAGDLFGPNLRQAKMHIGAAGDAYEREADSMADTVLRMSAPETGSDRIGQVAGSPIQRVCTECEEELRRQPMEGKEEEDEEEFAQRKTMSADSGGEAPPPVQSQISTLRGRGEPMPPSLRTFFEPRFNHDFGGVRLHTGSTAAASARAMKARAFTVGNDIAFNAGEYAPQSRSGRRLLAHELTHVVQQTPLVARRAPLIQRKVEPAMQQETPGLESEQSPPTPEAAPVPQEETTPQETSVSGQEATTPGLLVEDGETELGPGQLIKSTFLAELRTGICNAADAELAGTAYSAQGCPTIELYLRYYEGLSAARIEQNLVKYVPEAAGVTDARRYIPLAAARVARSVASWVETGEITGVPEGLPTGLPGLSALAGVLFKARAGGPRGNPNPQAVQSQLGAGRPLNSTLNSRMGSAFGRSFSNVRVHTDSTATRLTNRHNARAFTVGNHVAFGAGEYRPNNLQGDALLAHELAHVAQQDLSPPGVHETARSGTTDLENDADFSAVHAVVSLYDGLKGYVGDLSDTALPRLRSGLQLRRCSKSAEQKEIERLAKIQRTFMTKEIEDKKRKEAEKKRQAEITRRKKAGEKDPKVPPVKDEDVKASEADIADFQKKKATPAPPGPTKKWDTEVAKDAGKSFKERAKKAIEKVTNKAKSKPAFDDIAKMLKTAPPIFNEETAKRGLVEGDFAWTRGDKFFVSMDWIEAAEKEPRNVFANIAHEIGGHIVYSESFSTKIADEVINSLDAKTRAAIFPPESQKKAHARAKQAFFLAYGYPETEIYGELRERKWVEAFDGFTPTAQTDLPDVDIPKKLATIKKNWAPEVAQVILQRLVDRARKDPGIRAKDVTFLIAEIGNAKFPFTIK